MDRKSILKHLHSTSQRFEIHLALVRSFLPSKVALWELPLLLELVYWTACFQCNLAARMPWEIELLKHTQSVEKLKPSWICWRCGLLFSTMEFGDDLGHMFATSSNHLKSKSKSYSHNTPSYPKNCSTNWWFGADTHCVELSWSDDSVQLAQSFRETNKDLARSSKKIGSNLAPRQKPMTA